MTFEHFFVDGLNSNNLVLCDAFQKNVSCRVVSSWLLSGFMSHLIELDKSGYGWGEEPLGGLYIVS